MLRRLGSARAWLRAHPTTADAALALALGTASVLPLFVHDGGLQRPGVLNTTVNVALLVAGALALIWRRRAAAWTLVAVLLAYAALRIGRFNSTVLVLGLLLAAVTVGMRTDLRKGLMAVACVVPVLVVVVALNPGAGTAAYPEVIAAFCGAWWIGRSQRLRTAYISELVPA